MKCALCQQRFPDVLEDCPGCDARNHEALHHEFRSCQFVIAEIPEWTRQGLVLGHEGATLKVRYNLRQDQIRRELIPVAEPLPEPEPEIRIVEELPPPIPKPLPKPKPRPVTPPPPPPPPKEPFSMESFWRNLSTEKNIRWLLNLGIFIFAIGLGVFIHTQWESFSAGVKVGFLFGCTAIGLAAGHGLNRTTILKATGMALVILSAISAPINFAAIVQFGMVPSGDAHWVGLAASILCGGLYLLLSRIHREKVFTHLTWVAGVGTFVFGLMACGLKDAHIPMLVPMLALGYYLTQRKEANHVGHGALVGAVIWLILTPPDFANEWGWVVTALLPLAALGAIVTYREKRAAYSWLFCLAIGATLGELLHAFSVRDPGWILAVAGAPFALGWIWSERSDRAHLSIAPISTSLTLWIVSLTISHPDYFIPAGVIAVAHVALGLWRKDVRHSTAGLIAGGAAIVAGLFQFKVDINLWPIAFLAYGILLPQVKAFAKPRLALSVIASGAGLIFFCARYLEYYYTFNPLLGAAVCALGAAAFFELSRREKNRMMTDVLYGMVAFAYILTLKATGVPPKWLGVAALALVPAFVLLRKKLVPPTTFTGVSSAVAAGIFALTQGFVLNEHPQAAIILLAAAGFYAWLATRSPWKWVHHVAVGHAMAGGLVLLRAFVDLPVEAHTLGLLAVPMLALLGAEIFHRLRRMQDALHLSVAGILAAALLVSFTYLNPVMFEKANLPYAIGMAFVLAAAAGYFTFRKPERVNGGILSAVMNAFATLGYLLYLEMISTGSPYGGLAIVALAAVQVGAALLLMKRFGDQSVTMIWMAVLVACIAVGVGYWKATPDFPTFLYVYAIAAILFGASAWRLRDAALMTAGSVMSAAGLVSFLVWGMLQGHPDWLPLLVFPVALLAGWARSLRDGMDLPVKGLAYFSAGLSAIAYAILNHDLIPTGFILLGMTGALAVPAWIWKSRGMFVTAIIPAVIAMFTTIGVHPTDIAVYAILSQVCLAAAVSFKRMEISALGAVLGMVGIGCLTFYLQKEGINPSLQLFAVAAIIGCTAYTVYRNTGRELSSPWLLASFLTAAWATGFGWEDADMRSWLFLGNALYAGLVSYFFRLPKLMYLSSACVVATYLSFMQDRAIEHTLVELLALSLVGVVFGRGKFGKPVFYSAIGLAAVAVLGGTFAFGQTYVGDEAPRAILGLIGAGCIYLMAAWTRKIPHFKMFGFAHFVGAYYLTLHALNVDIMEFYTIPVGLGFLAIPKRNLLGDIGAMAALVLPSMVASFFPNEVGHMLAALGLSVGVVILGMALRRRSFLIGGTALFVGEWVGQAITFLVRQSLSAAEWGMIVGALIFIVAGAIESRHARFVKRRLEMLRNSAQKYFAEWS